MRHYYLVLAFAASLDAESLLNGQSGTNVPINTWTQLAPTGPPAENVGFDRLVYVSSIDMHVNRGTYHQLGTEPNLCYTGYSYTLNRWSIIDCTGIFPTDRMPQTGHPVGMMVHMPIYNSILEYGQGSSAAQVDRPMRTFWYDVDGRFGRDKFTTPMPGLLTLSTMMYAPAQDKAYMFWDGLNTLASYTPSTNTWVYSISTTGAAHPGFGYPSSALNTENGKIYYFGGYTTGGDCSNFVFTNTVSTFDPATNTWAALSTTGGPPTARTSAGWAYSPKDNIFLMVGGGYCPGGASTGLNDTWTFDPSTNTWTQITPSANYTLNNTLARPYEKVSYDENSNAFVMQITGLNSGGGSGSYADGTWTNNSTDTWAFCYTPCSKAGRDSQTFAPTSGYLNRYTTPLTAIDQSNAIDPAITSSGTTGYIGWVETMGKFAANTCVNRHPHVFSQGIATAPSALDSDCTTMDSELSSTSDASNLSMAYVNGVLWAAWEKSNVSNLPKIYVKYRNGSTWTGGVLPIVALGFHGRSELLAAGTTPTIAFVETEKSAGPNGTDAGYLLVRQWGGSTWDLIGSTLNASQTRVESFSAAANGTTVAVCYVQSKLTSFFAVTDKPAAYCKTWNGSSWSAAGSNISDTSNWTAGIAAGYLSSELHVAYTERTATGYPALILKKWNGSSWASVSTDLRRNTFTGWPINPRILVSGSTLYISWVEADNFSSPGRLHVSSCVSGTCTALGSSLNKDSAFGSISNGAMAIVDSTPMIVWTEQIQGNLRQAYQAKWDGVEWVPVVQAAADYSSRISGSGRGAGVSRVK